MQQNEPKQERVYLRRGGEKHEMRKESEKKGMAEKEMATSDLTVRIKRGLVRDKERDYNQTEPVVQLLVRQHTKHVIN